MIILSVDYGKARTGLAICDPCEMLASPIGTVPSYNEDKLLAEVCSTAAERKAELIVLGLPRNMDGSEGFSAQGVRAFGDRVAEASGLQVDYFDERCTTMIAHSILNQTNTRGKKRKSVVDTLSAEIILQSYLDSDRK